MLSHMSRPALAEDASAPSRVPDPLPWAPRDLGKLIGEPKEALSVFDFEPVMKNTVPAAHFGYMATGLDDEVTLRANREAFLRYRLRPRRLVDVSKIDLSCEILGAIYETPIVLAPTGSNRAFHPDGELAVARAARVGNHLQILSTVATASVEEAAAARGAPIWFQLYPTREWAIGDRLVKRAERAGCPVIVLTLDTLGPQKWETFTRLRRSDARACGSCHGANSYLSHKPN